MTLSEQEIENIIQDEIKIDAYSEMEVYVGWEIYMKENLSYPFRADYLIKLADGKENWTRIDIINRIENQAQIDKMKLSQDRRYYVIMN